MTLDLAVDVLFCFNFERAARSEYVVLLTDQVFLILVGIMCIITGLTSTTKYVHISLSLDRIANGYEHSVAGDVQEISVFLTTANSPYTVQ
jgi:hypothetical protein